MVLPDERGQTDAHSCHARTEFAMTASTASNTCLCQVRFASLFAPGRSLAFPCDAQGHVDLDALPDRARHNYLFARAMVGKDFARPCISIGPSASASPSSATRTHAR
jgi:hypothetical protein